MSVIQERRLSRKQIREFQGIYQKVYGEAISFEESTEHAKTLIKIVRLAIENSGLDQADER